jgi:hypothetical protein
MSTRRKPNSYRPGSTRPEYTPPLVGLTFGQRLTNYTDHPAAKRNQRPDEVTPDGTILTFGGLSPRQYRRLIKKDRHAWRRMQEG